MMLAVFLALALVIAVFYHEEKADSSEILCPSCSRIISSRFYYCPHCRFQIKTSCNSCGKPVNWDWRQCPHCRNQVGEE